MAENLTRQIRREHLAEGELQPGAPIAVRLDQALLQLGIEGVFARSFARIHRRNLVAQGIFALTFADDADYARAEVGQTWEPPRLRRELEDGAEVVTARIEEIGVEIGLRHDLAPKEREIQLAGGLLGYLRRAGAGALAEAPARRRRGAGGAARPGSRRASRLR